ncbi:MAG: HNH endonuclease [Halobacteriovoraceae bacterium]|nr:HNH endonuclease [Halobacteriovoraceae bacterium]|tara:strand:+ start:15117 stop:15629 length:513 start_codon:yes stop_codon:yes gene_type:complete
MRTLVLDSTYFPVRIVSWQRAMILFLSGRAEMVTEYSDRKIQGVSQSFTLPKILRLHARHKSDRKVRFSRHNVFWRDAFQCQYCKKKELPSKLTLDHVLPQSRGGKTTWENIVSCCSPCNTKKANRLPHEAGMKLLKRPKIPKWSPQLYLRLKNDDPEEWNQWFGLKKMA